MLNNFEENCCNSKMGCSEKQNIRNCYHQYIIWVHALNTIFLNQNYFRVELSLFYCMSPLLST